MDRTKWIVAALFGALALIALWWLKPSGGDTPASAEEVASETKTAGPVEVPISPDQARALSLRFAAAESAEVMPIATLPAMIVPPPNARVAVATQLPGVVTRIFVVEGDMVRAGQTLATVSSRDMVSLSAELARARARLSVAQANAGRIGQLSSEGIVAPARADEAQAALREAQVDVEEHARLVGMTGGSQGSGSYALTAPISGRVSAMTVETGKAIDPGAAPFVIDGSGPLQAQAQIPERLIGTIRPGMSVHAGRDVTGEVIAVGSVIDPSTRSATLTARFPAGAPLRSGQSLSLAVMGPAPEGAVRVSASAIAKMSGETVVFVQTPKGAVMRKVALAEGGSGTQGEQVVLSGLKPGEHVVISAVSELKALAAAD